jgi:hypothetical protein
VSGNGDDKIKIHVITPQELVEQIRERANSADGDADRGGTKSHALSLRALRLELRASTLAIVDCLDDLARTVERGLAERGGRE